MDSSSEDHINILWESFLGGDDKSFSLIYQLHAERLLEYGYKLCLNRALVHDSLQEIFIDLFVKRKKLKVNIKNLKAYLFIAFRNSLIKKITKSKKFEPLQLHKKRDDRAFHIEYSYQENLILNEISNEIKEELGKAIEGLPAKQKEIIYLKFEEGMDYSEISDILKISIESSRKLLYRALLTLRKTLHLTTAQIFMLIFQKKVT